MAGSRFPMDVRVRLRCADVVFRRLGDERLVIDLQRHRVHRLDKPGALIVDRLLEGESLRALVASVVEVFDVTEKRALRDVEGLIALLAKEGLVDVLSIEATEEALREDALSTARVKRAVDR
jgi:hypothetical protein